MKARGSYREGPKWESINFDEVKQIHLTPFAYFNIEFKDGSKYSYDKLDMTND